MKSRWVAITITLLVLGGVLAVLAPSGPSDPPPAADPPSAGNEGAPEPAAPAPAPAAADVELDKAKQQAIWDAEHITFEIEHLFGRAFLEALANRDTARLAAFLRPEFEGLIFASRSGEVREQAGLRELRLEASAELRPAAPAELVAALDALRAEIGEARSRTLRVLSINRDGPEVWDTRLLLSLAGPRPAGGLAEFESTHHVRFGFREEHELDTRPVVLRWEDESLKLRTADQPFLVEITDDVGLDDVDLPDNWELQTERAAQYRFQLAVDDFDRDGWLDLAVAEFGRSKLLRWTPEDGRFREVTSDFGVRPGRPPSGRPNVLASWIDYDNDGYPDLLLGSRLYHNDQGRRFTDVTDRSGLSFRPQAMGAHVVDYDCDGRLDLYILYQGSQSIRPGDKLSWINDDNYGDFNCLWRNEGHGRFRDVTLASNASAGRRHTLAATWFFYDDDHLPDVYVANDMSINSLLRNNGDGTFRDVSDESRTTDFATSMGVASGDTDNDGTSDLYIANMYSKMGRRIIGHVGAEDYPPGIFEQIQGSCAGNRLYRRAPGRTDFEEFGEAFGVEAVGWAYAPAMADLDSDGWLDLYATTGFLSFERGEPDG